MIGSGAGADDGAGGDCNDGTHTSWSPRDGLITSKPCKSDPACQHGNIEETDPLVDLEDLSAEPQRHVQVSIPTSTVVDWSSALPSMQRRGDPPVLLRPARLLARAASEWPVEPQRQALQPIPEEGPLVRCISDEVQVPTEYSDLGDDCGRGPGLPFGNYENQDFELQGSDSPTNPRVGVHQTSELCRCLLHEISRVVQRMDQLEQEVHTAAHEAAQIRDHVETQVANFSSHEEQCQKLFSSFSQSLALDHSTRFPGETEPHTTLDTTEIPETILASPASMDRSFETLMDTEMHTTGSNIAWQLPADLVELHVRLSADLASQHARSIQELSGQHEELSHDLTKQHAELLHGLATECDVRTHKASELLVHLMQEIIDGAHGAVSPNNGIEDEALSDHATAASPASPSESRRTCETPSCSDGLEFAPRWGQGSEASTAFDAAELDHDEHTSASTEKRCKQTKSGELENHMRAGEANGWSPVTQWDDYGGFGKEAEGLDDSRSTSEDQEDIPDFADEAHIKSICTPARVLRGHREGRSPERAAEIRSSRTAWLKHPYRDCPENPQEPHKNILTHQGFCGQQICRDVSL